MHDEILGSKNLLKWKGVMFGIDEGDRTMAAVNVQTPETTTTTSSEPDSSCATMIEINSITADNAKDINPLDRITFDDTTHEVISFGKNVYSFIPSCGTLFFFLLPPSEHYFILMALIVSNYR